MSFVLDRADLSSPAAYGNSFVSFSLPFLSPKLIFHLTNVRIYCGAQPYQSKNRARFPGSLSRKKFRRVTVQEILDSVMSGYIEMLLQLLDSGTVSMEDSFRFACYTMENGTKPTLVKQFGIT